MKGKLLKKVREIFVLVFMVPLVFFLLVEGVLRLTGVNTEIIKSKKFKVGIPLWAHNEANFAIAGDVYKQILDNELPADSVEWMKYFEESPHVHYKLKPEISIQVSNTVNKRELEEGIKVKIHSNEDGFRTSNLPRKKGKGNYRIVFLGDSTTYGWGVNQKQRFSEILQERLNASQDRLCFEIINMGIPGYSSAHGVETFDHFALKYDPDMLVVSFGANDSRKVPVKLKKALKSPQLLAGIKDFLGNFKTYRLIRKLLLSKINPFDKETNKEQLKNSPREAIVTLQEYTRNLEYIIEKSKQKDIEVVLLGLCCPMDYLAKMSAVAKRHGLISMDGMHIMLREIRKIREGTRYAEWGRYYLNLYGEDILEKRRILYVTSDTCHPNIIGHKILAQALFERVFKDKF